MKYKLHFKWFILIDFEPFFRIDQYPVLLLSAALAVLFFELFFFVTIFIPKLRALFGVGAVLFHLSVKAIMNMSFSVLWPLFIPLINWYNLLHRYKIITDVSVQTVPKKKYSLLHILYISLILLLNIVSGFLNYNSWPFGTYPTFTPQIRESAVLVRIYTTKNSVVSEVPFGDIQSKFNGAQGWFMRGNVLLADTSLCTPSWVIISFKNKRYTNITTVEFIAEERYVDFDLRDKKPIETWTVCQLHL